MIIVEGPDASGKTTLAKYLAEKYDLKYRRPEFLSSTRGPSGIEIVEWWKEELRWHHQHPVTDDTVPPRIYDRCFYISECIYQPMMQGRKLILDGLDMMRGIHDLWTIGPLIIFCLPPWESQAGILRNEQHAKLEGVTDEQHEKIAWVYECYWAMWQEMTNTYRYDYTASLSALLLTDRKVEAYLGR